MASLTPPPPFHFHPLFLISDKEVFKTFFPAFVTGGKGDESIYTIIFPIFLCVWCLVTKVIRTFTSIIFPFFCVTGEKRLLRHLPNYFFRFLCDWWKGGLEHLPKHFSRFLCDAWWKRWLEHFPNYVSRFPYDIWWKRWFKTYFQPFFPFSLLHLAKKKRQEFPLYFFCFHFLCDTWHSEVQLPLRPSLFRNSVTKLAVLKNALVHLYH